MLRRVPLIVWQMLFVAYLALTMWHLAINILHEPFAFDAWNIAKDTHAEPFTWHRFFAYVADQYTHSNPRVGQPFTYLAYKLTSFAPVVTPIVWILFSTAIVTLGLGRWPSAKRPRDLALWTIAIGFSWFAIPDLGKILFCRAYCANYVYGAAIQLWFLIPLRLGHARDPRRAIPYGVLGVVAGMCNEHTGPTLVLFMMVFTYLAYRRDRTWPRLALAGTIGAAIGFAAIFFAPGQGERYDNLAGKVSLLGRLLQRGITANLDIYRDYLLGMTPLLVVIALVLVISAVRDERLSEAGRKALIFVGVAGLAGSLMAATLFVSPKLGSRLFLHGAAILLAAFIALADATLTSPRRLAPFVLLAVFASGYAIARTVPLFDRLAVEGAERIAALEASHRDTIFTAPSYEQVDDSWWFLGDDFRDIHKRQMIEDYFDLQRVVLRAVDLTAPLGVSDVRLVPRYTVSPPACLDQLGGLQLGTFRALDVPSIQLAAHDAIDAWRARLPAGTQLDQLDVVVDFVGTRPLLPRPTLILARWWPDRFEAPAGGILRKGVSRTRTLGVPPALAKQHLELYIYQVGGDARKLGTTDGPPSTYIPWKTGAYWELACDAQQCWVLAATRQTS